MGREKIAWYKMLWIHHVPYTPDKVYSSSRDLEMSNVDVSYIYIYIYIYAHTFVYTFAAKAATSVY